MGVWCQTPREEENFLRGREWMPPRGQLSIGFTLAIVPLAKAASWSSGSESQPGVIEKRMETYLDHACIDT